MDNVPLWLVYVVPIVDLFLLVGGLGTLIWRAGIMANTVENIKTNQEHDRVEFAEQKRKCDHTIEEVARIKGHLGLNGTPGMAHR